MLPQCETIVSIPFVLMDKTESVVKIDHHRRFAEVLMTLWGEEQRMRVGLGVISKL